MGRSLFARLRLIIIGFAVGIIVLVGGISVAGGRHRAGAGKYRVLVTNTSPGEPNPQLRFGTGASLSGIQIAAIVIGPLLILGSIIMLILSILGIRRQLSGQPSDPVATGQAQVL
jgi:hypothetical protein